MRKFLIALVLTVIMASCCPATAATAPFEGGLFGRGPEPQKTEMVQHNQTRDNDAPLGCGAAIMTALGAAYLYSKRKDSQSL